MSRCDTLLTALQQLLVAERSWLDVALPGVDSPFLQPRVRLLSALQEAWAAGDRPSPDVLETTRHMNETNAQRVRQWLAQHQKD